MALEYKSSPPVLLMPCDVARAAQGKPVVQVEAKLGVPRPAFDVVGVQMSSALAAPLTGVVVAGEHGRSPIAVVRAVSRSALARLLVLPDSSACDGAESAGLTLFDAPDRDVEAGGACFAGSGLTASHQLAGAGRRATHGATDMRHESRDRGIAGHARLRGARRRTKPSRHVGVGPAASAASGAEPPTQKGVCLERPPALLAGTLYTHRQLTPGGVTPPAVSAARGFRVPQFYRIGGRVHAS